MALSTAKLFDEKRRRLFVHDQKFLKVAPVLCEFDEFILFVKLLHEVRYREKNGRLKGAASSVKIDDWMEA